MQLDEIREPVINDLKEVDRLILTQLHSSIPLIQQIGEHIVHSGGKRLRPLLVLLAAKALGYEGEIHITLAAIIEFIHTATLLHDDVVDHSLLRRGQRTANAMWGNEASVLVGDFVYSRSFQLMATLNNHLIIKILADTTNLIAEGEVLQLLNRHDPDTTEQRYLEVIRCKTAALFTAATQLAAIINHSSAETISAMQNYGLHLGMAFQLIDDALDYSADSNTIGKNIGDDLAEGKPTLPLIYALKHAKNDQATLIRQAIVKGEREHLNAIQQTIASTQAIAYTYAQANAQAQLALNALKNIPASAYRQALEKLVHFAVDRKF